MTRDPTEMMYILLLGLSEPLLLGLAMNILAFWLYIHHRRTFDANDRRKLLTWLSQTLENTSPEDIEDLVNNTFWDAINNAAAAMRSQFMACTKRFLAHPDSVPFHKDIGAYLTRRKGLKAVRKPYIKKEDVHC
ncbi:hypothetical protein EX30DRAFT_352770 [Ascodesmis nigricans]|uniref:Uncharacterized protein n=1 Tax=Ascodesmis nigricans TaxID=341454 RepID=A0A4S2MM87_9PEZI|nr:hypothetical protein EX30DRAFT_352770 [Ascodesmis nigricans]